MNTAGDFGRTTLKSLLAGLPEQLIVALASFLKRGRKTLTVQKKTHVKNGSGSTGEEITPRWRSLGKILLRFLMLVFAVETANYVGQLITKMQKYKLGMRARTSIAVLLTFTTATAAQFVLKPFKLGIAVMCAISSVTRRSAMIRRWHLHPAHMFAVHMLHNYLITHRQDWADPEYVRLWSTAMPNLRKFYECTVARSYPDSLVGNEALKKMPLRFWKSIRRCLLALTMALSPAIVFNLCKGRFQKAWKFFPKIAVSSLALALLPNTLMGLPAAYAMLAGRNQVMHPALYAVLSALVSTSVFRIEKGERLNALQIYTEKVVLVAMLRKFVFLDCENEIDTKSVEERKSRSLLKEYFTSIFVGVAAVLHMGIF